MPLKTDRRPGVWQPVKRLIVGRQLATEEAPHQLLPKVLALPVFASDPLSSNAYATEEILLVLAAAGSATFWLVSPLSWLIATVVVIVIVSYRQTIRAYPNGGGSYVVAKENLGTNYGLVAASSLLTDYVLTVSVSVAAGVAAITAAAPGLASQKVSLAIGFVLLLMLANLRGLKESGTIFAIPTYAFVLSIWSMLVIGGLQCLGGCPTAASAALQMENLKPLTLFMILRAFASGSTALTGIEAVSNGVPAFRGRRPSEQAQNAVATITIMGFFTLSMFIGISLLARATKVHPVDAEIAHQFGLHETTVVAQIAEAVAGRGFLFFAVQATTAGILILAANTAYADFPRLSSILARDRFMPRQFLNRGDRLVFSNGIVVLSVLAGILIWLFDASVTKLIQLYVVGVFTTFTLSQAGMVKRWFRIQGDKWQFKATMNAIGGTTTGLVLVVVAFTKFAHGAWIVITAIPIFVAGFKAVHRHYTDVTRQLRVPTERPEAAIATHVLIPVARMDEATLRAVGYAKMIRPLSLRAVHIAPPDDPGAEELVELWNEWSMGFPLEVISRSDMIRGVRDAVRGVPLEDGKVMTVIVPERLRSGGWLQFLRRRRGLLLKAALLFERAVVVTDVPVVESAHRRPLGTRPPAPARNEAVVLVSAVHNASLRAVAYATGLRPTGIRAVTFAVDAEDTEQLMEDWTRQPFDVPLEILDSPYRQVRKPLIRLIRELKAEAPGTVVTVVLPEFVVRKRWHQFLHNQSALAIKARLLFEPDVVVTSVPFHLSNSASRIGVPTGRE
ncbi:MAG TPA: APC family permease [Actinomycetota bacterium]